MRTGETNQGGRDNQNWQETAMAGSKVTDARRGDNYKIKQNTEQEIP